MRDTQVKRLATSGALVCAGFLTLSGEYTIYNIIYKKEQSRSFTKSSNKIIVVLKITNFKPV